MVKKTFIGITVGMCIITTILIMIVDLTLFAEKIFYSLDALKCMICLIFIPISVCFNIVLHCILIKAINELIGDDDES